MEDVIFFDMDGTLLDTEKWYTKAWHQAFADCGYPLPMEDVLQLRSLGRPFCYEWCRKKLGPEADLEVVRARRTEIMKPWLEDEIPVKPMVCETLQALRDSGYRTAVVTASAEERTRKLLKKTGLDAYFDRIICASMVERGKPAPDIYRYAREEMQVVSEMQLTKEGLLREDGVSVYVMDNSPDGVHADRYAVEDSFDSVRPAVYAVEDSPNGVRSAAAAGCQVIMIPDLTQPDPETEKLLWKKAGTFAELKEIFSE
ncbi:MAG: HAD family phosphatase [Clostridiales bacterium]|nr:HAD family phosphatase [Clostridiales bacterium]